MFLCAASILLIFDSFVPWRHKILWLRALVDRIHRICSPNKIKFELKQLKKILSWNSFPKRIANSLIQRFSQNTQHKVHDTKVHSHSKQHSTTIWLSVPYIRELTTQLVKKFKLKFRRCLADKNIDIRVKEKTTKLCFFTNTKDKIPLLSRSNVVYKFSCPGRNSSYVGKTNRTLLSPHKNMRSQTNITLSTSIYAIVSFSSIFGIYAIYQIFLFNKIFHLPIQWTKNSSYKQFVTIP